MRIVRTLLPTAAIVFVGFLVIGLAMPVLPLYVHQRLGLNMFVVGLVGGATFGASLPSRFFAGNQADHRGAKRAVVTGLLIAAVAGVYYDVSLRIGGAEVALACVLIEAVGQAVIWLAPQCVLVLAGVGLTGIAYALVYPSFGVEAVRRAPPQSRGLTMGAYTACLDLALGIANPVLGAIAGKAGLESIFLISALSALRAAPIAMRLLRASARPAHATECAA